MQTVLLLTDRCPWLSSALSEAGLRTITASAQQALRRPGTINTAEIVIFPWQPGYEPTLEAHSFTAGVVSLYAMGTEHWAEVGPCLMPQVTACPSCLAVTHPQTLTAPHPALRQWISAVTALQALGIAQHGATDLAAQSTRWRLDSPGLRHAAWRRKASCQLPGCVG